MLSLIILYGISLGSIALAVLFGSALFNKEITPQGAFVAVVLFMVCLCMAAGTAFLAGVVS